MSPAALASLVRGPGYFVTGTDTGVGKTWVACRLAETARARGLRVGVLKPAESGGGGDAAALKKASSCPLPLELIRPYAFGAALAPSAAAALEGRRVALKPILKAYRAVEGVSDFTLVEGAGGLLVPYGPGLDGASIAKAMGLPLLIVARRGLGTINHSLLTLEAARARGLNVAALVLSAPGRKGDRSVAGNARQIARLGKVRVVEAG
ncbi:MAG TPA: dethiobiotin synthase [bacterium]|jgi:dethiobiotin synthetase|nr:dethiobiotin synthase [bacterium]